MSFDWQDKVVLITGAANGIGACVVKLALEGGAKVIHITEQQNDTYTAHNNILLSIVLHESSTSKKISTLVDKDAPAGKKLQDELNSKHGPKTRFYQCDITDDKQLFSAYHSLVEDQGNIDVVINNACLKSDDTDMYKTEIAVNLTALVSSTLKALELMGVDQGGKGGTIINIGSIITLVQTPYTPIYSSTKAAVLQFSNCIAKGDTFARTEVRILTVIYGITATPRCDAEIMLRRGEIPEVKYVRLMTNMQFQKTESAATGLIEAYKRGKNCSTWFANRGLPVRDISGNIAKAFMALGEYN